jgi:ABC-type lipoprotein export system ATPase subunit
MIRVEQLNKYFNRRKRNEIHVLNDVSLEFPDKGLVVLLGPSGSGKTTLLNVLGGLDKVQSGTIHFDDKVIPGYDVHTWDKIRNEYVGYIFQNYNLLPQLSVFDNIAFVLKMMGIKDPKIIEERVNYILRSVHMYPFRKKKGLQLSGGQQQRVAIARALVKNPRVIIADEPTGNLDSKNTLDIMNIIKQISQEKLVILVTHERHIAEFYGDRIIEVKDGQIIADKENVSSDEHHIGKDDTIYLKDYSHIADATSNGVNLSLYSDHEDELKDLDIKLIVKNKTLYLDIKSPYQKMKIVDDNSGVVIKDEHYVKKTREELIETNFDQEVLDNEHIDRQSKTMVSIKQTLWLAFQKILNTSRKGKLMLFSFMIAGMVIAVTVSMFSATALLKPEQFMTMPKGYLEVNRTNAIRFDMDDLDEASTYVDDFYINIFGSANLQFVQPNDTLSSVTINGRIDVIDHINERDLVYGEMPTNNEIVVSSLVADILIDGSMFQGAGGQDIGIWSYEYLVKEEVRIKGLDVRISGIVDSELPMIYMTESLAFLYISPDDSMLPLDYFDETLVAGVLPEDDQVLISTNLYLQMFGNSNYTTELPKTMPGSDLEISGVFTEFDDVSYVIPNSVMLDLRVEAQDTSKLMIYSDDPDALKTALEDIMNNITVKDIYDEALTEAKEARAEVIVPTSITAGVLIGISMIGFYFVIRSSLISRIYEVSVYRALGVKKNDIFVSFLLEIFVLTSVSTLIGYIVASFGLSKLSQGFIGEFNFFTVNALTFVVGLILAYVINILAGMFPIVMLLRKTPAQIMSQYDI